MESIVLDNVKIKDLKIALLERQLLQQRGQALLKEVEQSIVKAAEKVTQAFLEAGLDPSLNYNIDFENDTATPLKSAAPVETSPPRT